MNSIIKIFFYILFTFYSCSLVFSQPIVKDKPKPGEEVILLSIEERENNYYIEPIAIIKNRRVNLPPSLNNGESYSDAAKQFVFNYFQYGNSFFKANSGNSERVVTVNEEINSYKKASLYTCTCPVFAKVQLVDEKIKSQLGNSVFTNSMYLSNKKSNRNIVDAATKKTALKLFKEYYQSKNGIDKTELFEVDALYSVSYSTNQKNILVGKFTVTQKGVNLRKDVALILEAEKGKYNITFSKELYSYNESGASWYNSVFNFIDALDIDDDGQNELIFFKSGGESNGYAIGKKSSSGWKWISGADKGC